MSDLNNRQMALAYALQLAAINHGNPNPAPISAEEAAGYASTFMDFLEPKDCPAPKTTRSRKGAAVPAEPVSAEPVAQGVQASSASPAATASPSEDLGLGEELSSDSTSDAKEETAPASSSDDLFADESPAPTSASAAPSKSSAPAKPAPAAKKPASGADSTASKKASSKPPTIEDVRSTLTDLQTALGGKNAAIDHLVKYTNGGAKVLSALPEEKYATLIADARALIAAKKP